ncbi:MAG TPA: type IV pilus modification protein PilV [Woeseiaceae bacterium]|nr:type IV pilus modification protein PilV [Woeseiaceae bacterium]
MSAVMPPNAPTRALHVAYPDSRGLTLVEILIALLILSIGLLGLAGLQTASLKFNTSAYYRTQATALAYDLADRMRANRQAALDGAYTVAFQDPPPACDAAAVEGNVAQQDIATWRNALACRIPSSTGRVVPVGNEFTITVQWADGQDDEDMAFTFTTAL